MVKEVEQDDALHEALRLITAALDLLDQDGNVGAIGAQLDLARARLEEHLANLKPHLLPTKRAR